MIDNDTTKTIYAERKDFPLSTIREMYDDGEIITDPDYQRDYVYDNKRASSLIESLLIGIPIPVVYLCEQEDGTLNVIDGQQRIVSFMRFLGNDFALVGLQKYAELNKKKYKELDKPLQRRIKSSALSAVVIKESSKDLQYEIFARLNIGSVKLYAQELRNCIYRGSFNKMLEEIAKNNKIIPILFRYENKRKNYQEYILRFFALRDFMSFQSGIKQTLNSFMEAHQNDSESQVEEARTLFNGTMDIIKQVLGEQAFCMTDRDSGVIKDKFSGSAYDSIAIPFSFFSKHDLMAHADEIRDAITELRTKDDEYLDYTYAATGSRKRVIGRIMKVLEILRKVTGSVGNDEGSRSFSDEVKKELWVDGYKCSWCGQTILSIDDAEIDHAIPYSQGGKTDISNAQLLHRSCNRIKSDSIDEIGLDEEDDICETE